MGFLSFKKIERFFFEETHTFSGVFFFHFLVFLCFCTVGHRFVTFVFEKPLLFLEMKLIRVSVMVTLSGQFQPRLTLRHNSFHFEFVLRDLSYDHVNAVSSLLLRFFSLVILFWKARCLYVIFILCFTLLLKRVWTFQLFPFPVITLFLSLWFHHCWLNSWNINNINKNCKILDYRSILLTDTVFW